MVRMSSCFLGSMKYHSSPWTIGLFRSLLFGYNDLVKLYHNTLPCWPCFKPLLDSMAAFHERKLKNACFGTQMALILYEKVTESLENTDLHLGKFTSLCCVLILNM